MRVQRGLYHRPGNGPTSNRVTQASAPGPRESSGPAPTSPLGTPGKGHSLRGRASPSSPALPDAPSTRYIPRETGGYRLAPSRAGGSKDLRDQAPAVVGGGGLHHAGDEPGVDLRPVLSFSFYTFLASPRVIPPVRFFRLSPGIRCRKTSSTRRRRRADPARKVNPTV